MTPIERTCQHLEKSAMRHENLARGGYESDEAQQEQVPFDPWENVESQVHVPGLFMHGTYIGTESRLKGKTALLQPSAGDEDRILAQFDDKSLKEAFDWHLFDCWDFEQERKL